jgi:hypothetical protein
MLSLIERGSPLTKGLRIREDTVRSPVAEEFLA